MTRGVPAQLRSVEFALWNQVQRQFIEETMELACGPSRGLRLPRP
jgi:hypothetical protein